MPSVYIGIISVSNTLSRGEKKHDIQIHASIKRRQNFVIKTDEISSQKVLLYLPQQNHVVRIRQFPRKSCEFFSHFDLKHSLPYKIFTLIAGCYYVNLLIFLTILGSLTLLLTLYTIHIY